MNVKKIAFIENKKYNEVDNLFSFLKNNNVNFIEKCFYSFKPEEIKKFLLKFERIYFGVEFCEKKIPSVKELAKVVELCQQNNVKFSFVTPYVTDFGIERIKKAIKILQNHSKNCEVIVNDWGIFQLLREDNFDFEIVLGRILTKQKKDPRIINIKNKKIMSYFSKTSTDNKYFRSFLKENKVYRVEFDNTFQDIEVVSDGLKFSLYYPYVYLTTSKNCFVKNCKNCESTKFILQSSSMGCDLFLKGKTQFYKNYDLTKVLWGKFSRLVFQSQFPF